MCNTSCVAECKSYNDFYGQKQRNCAIQHNVVHIRVWFCWQVGMVATEKIQDGLYSVNVVELFSLLGWKK